MAPLALRGGLWDAQQAANGVGGSQRVGLGGLGRGDRRAGDWGHSNTQNSHQYGPFVIQYHQVLFFLYILPYINLKNTVQ